MSDITQEILSHNGDTCIKASAGTGKTYILVEKFLTLIKREEEGEHLHLKNILALTFTEKAAEEMRSRIALKLHQEAEAISKTADSKHERKLAKHLESERRKMSQAYISTIHSFCARVLRENPVEAGVDPQFEIMDQHRASAIQTNALQRFLLWKLRNREADTLDLAYRYGYDSDFRFESSLTSSIDSLLPLVRAAGYRKEDLLLEYQKLMKNGPAMLDELLGIMRVSLEKLSPWANSPNQVAKVSDSGEALSVLSPQKDFHSCDGLRRAEQLVEAVKGIRFNKEEPKEIATTLKENSALYSAIIVSSLAFESAGAMARLVDDFHLYLEREAKGRGRLDFDDLQEKVLYLFNRSERVRDHYRDLFKHLLIDEYQDLNGLQKAILDHLAPAGEGRLFIVGDAKQAIYGFRGGDFENFRDAEQEIAKKGGLVRALKTNYRSNGHLVAFVNALFGQYHPMLFAQDDECTANATSPTIPSVERITMDTTGIDGEDALKKTGADEKRYREAVLLAARLRTMVENERLRVRGEDDNLRPVRYGDVAILFRKFTSLTVYEAAFERAGVPYLIHKGTGFYTSNEVADLISVLSYIDDPSDPVSWAASLRSPLACLSDDTLLKLRRAGDGGIIDPRRYVNSEAIPETLTDINEKGKFRSFMQTVARLMEVKDRMTVSELLETLVERTCLIGVLGAQPAGLQKAGNVLKLIEQARMMERDGTVTLKNFVVRLRGLYDGEVSEPNAPLLQEEANAIKIMTLHQSKGLEFPVVALADIGSAGKGPSPYALFNARRGMALKYVDPETMETKEGTVFNTIKELNAEKEKDDSARLFYVGCTRARDRLILSGTVMTRSGNGFAEQADAMLLDHPEYFHAGPVMSGSKEQAPKATAYDILSEEERSIKIVDHPGNVAEREPHQRKLSFTVTSLASYVRCPREYLFKTLYKIDPPPAKNRKAQKGPGAAETGSAVHAALERANFTDTTPLFVNKAIEEVRARLTDLPAETIEKMEKEFSRFYKRPVPKKIRDGSLKIVGREIPFSFSPGNGLYLDGQIDLLLREGTQKAIVADYKYSAGGEDEAYRFQLSCYALAASKFINTKEVGCVVLYLKGPDPTPAEWTLDQTGLKETEARLLEVVSKVSVLEEEHRQHHGRFVHEAFGKTSFPPPPEDTKKCYRCFYKPYCG